MPQPIKELLKDKTLWKDGFRTESGLPVRIYAIDGEKPFSIHGAILDVDGWVHEIWSPDGVHCPGLDSKDDLVPARRVVKGFVNIYGPACTSMVHMDRGQADFSATSTRIACVEVEFAYTPGEGL